MINIFGIDDNQDFLDQVQKFLQDHLTQTLSEQKKQEGSDVKPSLSTRFKMLFQRQPNTTTTGLRRCQDRVILIKEAMSDAVDKDFCHVRTMLKEKIAKNLAEHQSHIKVTNSGRMYVDDAGIANIYPNHRLKCLQAYMDIHFPPNSPCPKHGRPDREWEKDSPTTDAGEVGFGQWKE
jgi:hypothetical protein